MNFTAAKFVRKYNVGQYESEEYTLEANIDEGENAIDVLKALKAEVAAAHAGEEAPEKEEEKPAAKKAKAKKEAPPVEEDDSDDDDSDDDDDKEEEPVEKKSKLAPVKSPAAPTKKGFKKKPQSYNRDNEQHKEIFSTLLKEVAPEWKKSDAGKAKAKTSSVKMVGKDFLDSSGEVLSSFKAEVKKLMAAKK